MAQTSEIFENIFPGWYTNLKEAFAEQGQPNLPEEVVRALDKDYFFRDKVEIWLGGKDRVLRARHNMHLRSGH